MRKVLCSLFLFWGFCLGVVAQDASSTLDGMDQASNLIESSLNSLEKEIADLKLKVSSLSQSSSVDLEKFQADLKARQALSKELEQALASSRKEYENSRFWSTVKTWGLVILGVLSIGEGIYILNK